MLYNKHIDTHLYLEYSSAHPSTVPEKGTYGQYQAESGHLIKILNQMPLNNWLLP